MATYTSYYNLTKPEGTERVNIGIINQNMDAIDTQMYKNAQSIIANHGGMAIPSNNNTHAAVSSGQYVYVYNHSSLAEGMYVAKSAISTNGSLSLSNLEAVTGGGLNHVYSTLNSNIENCMNRFSIGQVNSSKSITLSVSSGAIYGLLVGISGASARHVFAIITLRDGTAFCTTISSQNVTVQPDGNNIVITSDNTYGANMFLVPFNQKHIDNLVIT